MYIPKIAKNEVQNIYHQNMLVMGQVGEWLKYYRQRDNLSYRDIAKKAGTNHVTIMKIMKKDPSFPYCSISFLSILAQSFNGLLFDWIRQDPPNLA